VPPFSFMSTVSLNHLRVNESGARLLHNIRGGTEKSMLDDFSCKARSSFSLPVDAAG